MPLPINSFVLRQGRITQTQQQALQHYAKQHLIKIGQYSASDQIKLGLIDVAKLSNKALITALEDWPSSRQYCLLEIGFGNGHYLLAQAKRNPHDFHLGIEVHLPGLARLLHQAANHHLSNLKLLRLDAKQLLISQTPLELFNEIRILFPDPWPKRRHHKRRLLDADFIKTLCEWLKPKGRLILATDWQPYAQVMQQLLQQQPQLRFSPYRINLDTHYQRRGLSLGHRISQFCCVRQ